MKPRTAGEMLKLAREFLLKKGIEEARLEAELLVAHALGLDRLALFLQHDRPIGDEELARGRELLVRRGKREPTAYLTGSREFYGRSFAVGPGALIPRPETEIVVDRAREIARGRAASGSPLLCAADYGTGSGILAITLALEIEGLHVLAVDASDAALSWARRNVERHALSMAEAGRPVTPTPPAPGADSARRAEHAARADVGRRADLAARADLARRVELALGDGVALLLERARERPFDLVVANPPYVTRAEEADLAPEVRDHEPASALFAPAGDPDHHLARLLDLVPRVLAPGGTLLVELGHRQGPRARGLAHSRGLEARIGRDFAGIERVLETRRPV
ncbi:MAG: peptide chain release factor N(5)-glutamine methyltransferase [Planctomycetes bacterium]|nr:peptide chain release factor N(5)-glutamine methyltransferase [Planctomycetota bacterium]